MSVDGVAVQLGIKITYNLNDSPQLRLARHPPTNVTIYPDSDSSTSQDAGSSSRSNYVGSFAELPLKTCVMALTEASPELLCNVDVDYSVYVNDPTEAADAVTSGVGVLVGKGLLSSVLSMQDGKTDSTVFGKVVKDGIRGQSVLVHLVLEKTSRVPRPTQDKRPTSTDLQAPVAVPHAGDTNPNISALLSLLSSSSTVSRGHSSPPSEVANILSAFAARYHTPANVTTSTSTTPPCVVKEEDEIVEIPCIPTPQPCPAERRKVLTSIENVMPDSAPPSLPKSQSLPKPRPVPAPAAGAVQAGNKTPFVMVPALQPRNQPVAPLPAPVQALAGAAPTTYTSRDTRPSTVSRRKYLMGPHGNGWYRRSDLPPPPSSDPPSAAAVASEGDILVVKDNGKNKKRLSDTSDDGARKKRRKTKASQPTQAAMTSPVRSGSKENAPRELVGNKGRPMIQMAATSPIRSVAATTIKRITLKTKPASDPPSTQPAPRAVTESAPSTEQETPTGTQPEPKIRTLNFLSLMSKPFQRSQSECAKDRPSPPQEPLPAAPITCRPSSPLGCPEPRPPCLTTVGLVLAATPTSLPSRPSTPVPAQSVPNPRTPPPRTPRAMRVASTAEIAAEDSVDEGSPLFLPTPTTTRSVRCNLSAPSTPSRTTIKRDVIRDDSMLCLGSESDDSSEPCQEALDAMVPSPNALDMAALNLPPSSPPSSFASSSPSVSPRFTLDSVVDGIEDAPMEDATDVDTEQAGLNVASVLSDSCSSATNYSNPPTSDAVLPESADLAALLRLCDSMTGPQKTLDDVWSAFGIDTQPKGMEPLAGGLGLVEDPGLGGMLAGSDLFDFEAATAHGFVDETGCSTGVSAFDVDFDSLINSL